MTAVPKSLEHLHPWRVFLDLVVLGLVISVAAFTAGAVVSADGTLLIAGIGIALVPLWLMVRRGHSVFGPVFYYDLVRTMRRGRHIPLRCLYAGLLLLALFSFYSRWFANAAVGPWDLLFHQASLPQHELSRLAGEFADTFLVVQFGVVVVLTPVFAAGAITEEKERRTFEYLLLTELTNVEIVLGKLASRLSGLALLLLTGLPVLGLTVLWGGVDAHRLLAAFVATGMTMLSIGCLGLICSVEARSTLMAIVATYSFMFLLNCMGVFCISPATAALQPDGFVPLMWASALVNALLAGLLAALAIHNVSLRRQATRFGRHYRSPGWGYVEVSSETLPGPSLPLRKSILPDQPIRGRKHAARRPIALVVGDYPLLWKELFLAPRINILPVTMLAGLALFAACMTALGAMHTDQPMRVMNTWVQAVGALAAAVVLLMIAFSGATSVSREREQNTLEALFTLPLERKSLLSAKWLGSVLSARWLAVALGVVWLLGLATGALHLLAVPLLAAAVLVYAAFFAALGLYFSTVCTTSFRASVWTLLALLAVGIGPWVLPLRDLKALLTLVLSPQTANWFGLFVENGLRWPVPLWLFSFPLFGAERDGHELLAALLGLLAYGLGALLFWHSARRHFERM